MPLILAIEPERRQAAQLTNVVRGLGADLILVDTTERALDAIGSQVPDLVLVPALLSPQDDALLAGALRVIATAARVQMLTTPVLEAPVRPAVRPSRMLAALRRDRAQPPAPIGCDPNVFADQISSYLERAAEERAAAAEIVADASAMEQSAVEPSIGETIVEEPLASEPILLGPGVIEPVVLEPALAEPAVLEREPVVADAIPEPVEEPPTPEIEPFIDVALLEVTAPEVIEPVTLTQPDAIEPEGTDADEPWPSWRRDAYRVQWPEMQGAPVAPEPKTPSPDVHVEQSPEPLPAVVAVAPVEPPAETAEPPRPPANTEREWVALIDSLRQDVERLRAERQPALEAVNPAPASAIQKPSAPARPLRVASPSSRRAQKPRPIQDEWGFFDPDQCGFPALLAKLKEIEQAGGAPPDAAD